MHRVIIFTNSASWVPSILIRATLAALASRNDMQLAGVCVPKLQSLEGVLSIVFRYRTRLDLKSLLGSAFKHRHRVPLPINLNRWARRFQFRILVPPGGNINHPHFIARIRDEIRPTIALSFYCLQKFSPTLLATFSAAVNYHNGLLPEYRGIAATAWSVYHGEKETSFTFHRMTNGLDEGPILAQAAIPVRRDKSTHYLEAGKAHMAATFIPRVLDMVVNESPGEPQHGKDGYFSKERHLAVTRISDPSTLSSVELM